MIYTVTFNPSLDYIVRVDDWNQGEVVRTAGEQIFPGGKGVNVSIVMQNLGFSTKALGFKAGFTGEALEQMLRQYGCETMLIPIDNGFTRINVKLKCPNEEKEKRETDINGQGPNISKEHIDKLFSELDKIEEGDVLVLAGSIPNTLPEDIYQQIMARMVGKNIKTAVDATKDLLLNVLQYNPFLIKPNNHELGEMFGVKITNTGDIVTYAKKLQEMGARNVLVSMAGDGALLLTENGDIYQSLPPKGKVVNSVGAGDSMVSGFMAGYLNTGDYMEALKMGLCTGSATAFKDWLATKEDVMKIYNEFNL